MSSEIQHTIQLVGAVARNPQVRLAAPASLDLLADEHLAIVGPNGAGKSLFVDLLTGKYPLSAGSLTYDFRPSATTTVYDNIKYIAFRDTYGSADANYYYQQRWNAHDQDDAPIVSEQLGSPKDDQLARQLFSLFQMEPLLNKKLILLSSGELRKFQLTKALLTAPASSSWTIRSSAWMHPPGNCCCLCWTSCRACSRCKSSSYCPCSTMCPGSSPMSCPSATGG